MKYCPECGTSLKSGIVDGEMHLYCPLIECDFVQWNNPVPVVMAVVQYEGQYIIANNVLWPKDVYSFITGYLDQYEIPEQAAVRELKEELGLEGEVNRFIGHYMFEAKNQLVMAFELVASGNIKLNHELRKYLLLSPEELSRYDFGVLYVTRKVVLDWVI